MSDCSKVKAYWSIFYNQLDLGAHMGALGYVITLTRSLLGLVWTCDLGDTRRNGGTTGLSMFY